MDGSKFSFGYFIKEHSRNFQLLNFKNTAQLVLNTTHNTSATEYSNNYITYIKKLSLAQNITDRDIERESDENELSKEIPNFNL